MHAGFAQVDITPPPGAVLNGFIARMNPSLGLDGPLFARVLWLDEHGDSCLIVSLDVLGLSPGFADRMVAELSAALGVSEAGIILACSHTHSGPMTMLLRGIGRENGPYLDQLASQIIETARRAVKSRVPVRAAWGTAPVDIGMNRRQMLPDGSAVLGVNPTGPRDTLVRALHLRGENRSIILFEHACHPYCLGPDSRLISPDFWGHAAAFLAEAGHDTVYLNGCAGDITPRLAFQGPKAARDTGQLLAQAVLTACGNSTESAGGSGLGVASVRTELPHDEVPAWPQVAGVLDQADRTVRDEDRDSDAVRRRIQEAWAEWLAELEPLIQGGRSLPPINARVSVVRIGEGGLVVLPGEVFFEIGDKMAAGLVADPVCMAAYGHGYIGYVPTPEAFPQGGYEVNEAHRYMGLWRITPRAGEIMNQQVRQLWQRAGGRIQ